MEYPKAIVDDVLPRVALRKQMPVGTVLGRLSKAQLEHINESLDLIDRMYSDGLQLVNGEVAPHMSKRVLSEVCPPPRLADVKIAQARTEEIHAQHRAVVAEIPPANVGPSPLQ